MVVMTNLDGRTTVALKLLQDIVHCKRDEKIDLDLKSNEKRTRQNVRSGTFMMMVFVDKN
ncbi:hypothetical protein HCH59_05465 [Enterococcus faecalis]|nr:hypothetical protein [Enterococcus faecalis]